ncbi:MAG: GAF domain-containing protein [Chloroflexi bacterium]|nr:GAF domain-containing protein [Chloroflexota bacterium]
MLASIPPSTARRPAVPRSQLILLVILLVIGAVAENLILFNYLDLSQKFQTSVAPSISLLPKLSALRIEVLQLHAEVELALHLDVPEFTSVDARRANVAARLEDLQTAAAGNAKYTPAIDAVSVLLEIYDSQIAGFRNSPSEAQVPVIEFELGRAFKDTEAQLAGIYNEEEALFSRATTNIFAAVRDTQIILLGVGVILFILSALFVFNTRRTVQQEVGRVSEQLQVAAEVGRAASSLLSLDELFDTTLSLIRDRFNFYHASIFLLDEAGENAVLRASMGEVGASLIKSGYKLDVGSDTIIGYVTANNAARVASDVSDDPAYFRHELLPNTRAELAVPLRQGGQVIGALDVQSVNSNAFPNDLVPVIQTLADEIAVAIGNAAQYTREKARAQQLATLLESSVELSIPQSNFDALLDLIARRSLTLMRANDAEIWLPLNDDEIELRANVSEPTRVGQRLRRGEGLPSQVFASGRPLRVEDYAKWESRTGAVAGAAFRAALTVPMAWQGSTVGVLTLTHSQPNWFSADDERIAQLFASQAAAAIENTRLLQETQNRLGELYTLNQIGQAVAAQTDLNGLFDVVRREVLRVINAPVMYISLYDSKRELLEIPYFYESGLVTSVDPFPVGHGLTGLIIQTRQPLVVNNAAEATTQGAIVEGDPAESYLGVPIIVRENVIGVLAVQDYEKQNLFAPADARLLSTIASQIALGVQSIQLYQQVQRRADQLAAASEVSRATISMLNPAQLIVDAVELIRSRFNLYYAAIFMVDDEGKWAMLRHATGDAGRQLLENGHRLEVGGNSMVGACIAQGQARIALDAGKERTRFANPLLPDTRSEMALPLRVGETVLGALDVQSTLHNAFSESDIAALQTMTDQIGIAIRNAQLLENAQHTLKALDYETYLLQTLLENVPDKIYFKDQEGRFIRVSKAVADRFNLPPEDMIGKWEFDFFTEAYARQVYEDEQTVLLANQPIFGKVEQELWPDGSATWALTTRLPLRDSVGHVIGTFGISRDVTELKAAEEASRRRAQQLVAASDVSRATISILDPDQLVIEAVEAIRERFDLYYAALFLVDDAREWAVLRHATGDAGKKLLERGHKLEVGGNSMVGWAVANRRARIALDVGEEPVRFVNPFLPDTHSEMALPLIVGNIVIGALDVQSVQVNAFSDADVSVLQTMADQIAVAIQNARLYLQVNRRARLEQLINRVTGKIRRSIDAESIISTTLSELNDILRTRRAVARLGPEHDLLPRKPGSGQGNGNNGNNGGNGSRPSAI